VGSSFVFDLTSQKLRVVLLGACAVLLVGTPGSLQRLNRLSGVSFAIPSWLSFKQPPAPLSVITNFPPFMADYSQMCVLSF
jgi:hypothetical protein